MINSMSPEPRGHSIGAPPHESVVHFGASQVMREEQRKDKAAEDRDASFNAGRDEVSLMGGDTGPDPSSSSPTTRAEGTHHHHHSPDAVSASGSGSGSGSGAQFEGAVGRRGDKAEPLLRTEGGSAQRSTREMMGMTDVNGDGIPDAGPPQVTHEVIAAAAHTGAISHETLAGGREQSENAREMDAEMVDSSQEGVGARADRANGAKQARRSSMQSNLGFGSDGGADDGEQPNAQDQRQQQRRSGDGAAFGGGGGQGQPNSGHGQANPGQPKPDVTAASAVVDSAPTAVNESAASAALAAAAEPNGVPNVESAPVTALPAPAAEPAESAREVGAGVAATTSTVRHLSGAGNDVVQMPGVVLSPGVEFVPADEYLFFDDARYTPGIEEAS